jgi:hypothetical protein
MAWLQAAAFFSNDVFCFFFVATDFSPDAAIFSKRLQLLPILQQFYIYRLMI